MRQFAIAAIALCFSAAAFAQADPEHLSPVLGKRVISSDVVSYELRQYLLKKVPLLESPRSAAAWTQEANRIRKHLLSDVVFHGWPKEWVESKPSFSQVGSIETGKGYRILKFVYDIVPGFQSAALLYVPEKINGKIPAILNVNGHVGWRGKSVEYKQKRCINFARRGILALNLEWLNYGELQKDGNDHSFAGHLDLVGANGVGLFYLAMRRGLDFLYDHPAVDRNRIGVTGLSGGGWQTITLSSLDERVAVAVPVAGFSAMISSIEHPEYIGNDMEQNATDFRDGQDYAHLVAMRAPRPTLLIYNAEDDCCFVGPLVKHGVYDEIRPFFNLFNAGGSFAYYENKDPGTHNYQLDNRVHAYAFFGKHFNIPGMEEEIPVDGEVLSYKELEVGLREDNLTILSLARQMAEKIERPASLSGPTGRERLRGLVRYKPVSVKQAWGVASTKSKSVETISYQLQFSNDISAAGVWVKSSDVPSSETAAIIMSDKGRKDSAEEVSDAVGRGEQALALDTLFNSEVTPENPGVPDWAQLLAATGDRPLGLEAAQVIAAARWLREAKGARTVRVQASGQRNQVIALIAAALEPSLFTEIRTQKGFRTLRQILDGPVAYESAPDLFCLDLYKYFDIDQLAALARPARVQMD